jgi:hypothetical protein
MWFSRLSDTFLFHQFILQADRSCRTALSHSFHHFNLSRQNSSPPLSLDLIHHIPHHPAYMYKECSVSRLPPQEQCTVTEKTNGKRPPLEKSEDIHLFASYFLLARCQYVRADKTFNKHEWHDHTTVVLSSWQ